MDTESSSIDELIAQARTNPEALGGLLERYRSYLLLVSQQKINIKVSVRCPPSDIVQETILDAYRGFTQFAGAAEAEFSAWLRKIHQHNLDDAARRHLLAKRRDPGQERRLDSPTGTASFTWRQIAADGQTPSDRVVAGERALRLAELVASLPEEQREAIRLRHIEGLPVAQIADQMERSLPAVAGLLKRGLQALRGKVHEESWF